MNIDISQVIKNAKGEDMNSSKTCFIFDRDSDQILKDGSGNPLMHTLETPEEVMTLKDLIVTALLGTTKGDTPDGKEKHRRYILWKRTVEADEAGETVVSYTTEDVSKIKKLIGNQQQPLISGQAWDMLEGEQETPVKKLKGKK